MPQMSERDARRKRIRELLTRNVIRNQQELQDLLAAEDMATTQATLSRDLRDLGVSKGREGYVIPAAGNDSTTLSRELERAIHGGVASIEQAGSLVVLRTALPGTAGAGAGAGYPVGMMSGLGSGPPAVGNVARMIAAAIDRARLRHVVGVIAGDDTIFIATHSVGQAGELLRFLRKLLRL
jgi:transcriptional regulator of arginine metabolism